MELRSIRKKGENIQVIGEITALYKYDGVSLTTEIIPAFNGVSSIVNYDEDVYLFVEQGKYFDVIRIGKPPAMMVIKDTESKRFNQYDTIGNLTGFINSVEIGQNYWKVVPLVIGRGYFELDGYKQPFDFGYDVNEQPVNTEGGITAIGNFIDTGYAEFGFLGNKHSYFDLGLGAWVDDVNQVAKASDLAKAVTHRYGLEWTDQLEPTHIYNYIKYLRTYDEELGVFRLYAPSITPESNAANFPLIVEDEEGNTVIRGISILLAQDLGVASDGSTGTFIDFRTV